MDERVDTGSLREALDRWRERGLLSGEQAEAIEAFETERGGAEPPPALALGVILAYAGTLVALAAIFGVYATGLDWAGKGTRVVIDAAVAAVAIVLAAGISRLPRGAAMTDALGFAATALVGWTALQGFDALGWLDHGPLVRGEAGYERALHELRAAFLVSGLVVVATAYVAARRLPSPLAALAAGAAAAWVPGVVGWWIGNPLDPAPGIAGGQVVVIAGLVATAVALRPQPLALAERGRLWWQTGALGAATVAAFVLAVVQGGAYEALLLVYAATLGAAAVVLRRRLLLIGGALVLYAYVGIVVFRTFEGAVAAIVVLALVGLGTAIGGTLGQREGQLGWARRRG